MSTRPESMRTTKRITCSRWKSRKSLVRMFPSEKKFVKLKRTSDYQPTPKPNSTSSSTSTKQGSMLMTVSQTRISRECKNSWVRTRISERRWGQPNRTWGYRQTQYRSWTVSWKWCVMKTKNSDQKLTGLMPTIKSKILKNSSNMKKKSTN